MAKRIRQWSFLLMRHALANNNRTSFFYRAEAKRKTIILFLTIPVLAAVSLPVLAYQEITVNEGGTIKGKVIYNGYVPKRTILPTKDKEVCGGIRKEPKILVNANKGVQEAVVHLKKVAKGKSWGKLSAKPTIDNKECRFVPHVQVVRKGNIEIVNSDPVLHNTHGFYGKRTAFNVALPNQHQRIKKPLRRTGQVRIECDAHGWMLAWVFVADSPYYALTNEDGAFTIENIPPGNYTLVGTQDYTGAVEVPVSVKANSVHNLVVELKR